MKCAENAKWKNFYDELQNKWEVIDRFEFSNRRGIVLKTPHSDDAIEAVEAARPLVHRFGICCQVIGMGYGRRTYTIKEWNEYCDIHGTNPAPDNCGYLAVFPSVPSSERLSVVCGIGKGSQFSKSNCTQILNVLSIFEWYSPYRVSKRFLEVDIPKLSKEDLPCLGSFLDSYIPLIKDIFGYKPSETQVINDMTFGKIWFADMSFGG